MKTIQEVVAVYPGSRLDAEGFAAQRCTSLYVMIAGGFADTDPQQRPFRELGSLFFGRAVDVQKRIDPKWADPHEISEGMKPMVAVYVARANEQRALTGNYMDDAVLKADERWCHKLAQK